MVACGDTVYAGTSAGRLLRLQGGSFTQDVAGGIAATGTVGALHCAGAGTLRVGSRGGLVTRRTASGWVDDHYAPTLRGVHFLRSTGAGFTSAFVAGVSRGPSIWGTATNNVLFIARNHPWLAGAGGIYRWNGSGTSAPFTGAIDSPLALSGSSSAFALATGAAGAVWLWNGSIWAPRASIPGASMQALNRLIVLSPTVAYAANDCISGQDGGAWRWNGSTWTDAGITAAGFPACVRALSGTGYPA